MNPAYFRAVAHPGWWWRGPPASVDGYPFLVVRTLDRWWRSQGYYPTADTPIIETSRGDLDRQLTTDALEGRAYLMWMNDGAVGQDMAPFLTRARDEQTSMVTLTTTAIIAAIAAKTAQVRPYPGRMQGYSVPLVQRGDANWAPMASLTAI